MGTLPPVTSTTRHVHPVLFLRLIHKIFKTVLKLKSTSSVMISVEGISFSGNYLSDSVSVQRGNWTEVSELEDKKAF